MPDYRAFPQRFIAIAVSIIMACSMTPAVAFAQNDPVSVEPANDLAAKTIETVEMMDEAGGAGYEHGEALVAYHASGLSAKSAAAAQSAGRLNVQYEGAALESRGYAVQAAWDFGVDAKDADGEETQSLEQFSYESTDDLRIALVSKDGMTTAQLIAELSELDFVEVAGPNYQYESASVEDPNDPLYDYQSNALGGNNPQGIVASFGVDYPVAYAQDSAGAPLGAKENVVAILDTGVDYNHPDLKDSMWVNPGNLGLGPAGTHGYNAYIEDTNDRYDIMPGKTNTATAHGTHIAGIIAAQANNSEGVAGIAGLGGHTKIMGIRIADSQDKGHATAAVVAGYEYMLKAREAGVNVVAANNSWGAPSDDPMSAYDPVLDFAINQAGLAGILTCFSAGNGSYEVRADYKTTMLDSPYQLVIAASDEYARLSKFSNYSATHVDVAFPGSNVLSTVPTFFSEYFCPLYSKKDGKSLTYYSDLASLGNNLRAVVQSSDGKEYPAGDAVKIVPVRGAFGSEDGVKVTIDYKKFYDAHNDPSDPETYIDFGAYDEEAGNYTNATFGLHVALQWDIDNPFLGKDLEASDYAMGAFIKCDETNWQASDGYQAFANLGVRDEAGAVTYLSNHDYTYEDMTWEVEPVPMTLELDVARVKSQKLESIDAESPRLVAQIDITPLQPYKYDEAPDAGPIYVTGYGIGRATDASTDPESSVSSYSLMSGTSMAAPGACGAVAELSWLYPDATPLEIRGRIVGGNNQFASAYDQGRVASGGTFSFERAMNDSLVSANTWSLDCGAGKQVVLNGFALGDATLEVDGKAVAVEHVGDSQIVFTGDDSLFDGLSHRFDVTDASTGSTHKASYVVGTLDDCTIEKVASLPAEAQSSSGQLIATESSLFFGDMFGKYFYVCDNPDSENPEWKMLDSVGMPCDPVRIDPMFGFDMRYVYNNGSIFAFCGCPDGDSNIAYIQAARFDIKTQKWSAFQHVEAIARPITNASAFAFDGKAYCAVVHEGYLKNEADMYTYDSASQTFINEGLQSGLVAHSTIYNTDGVLACVGTAYSTGDEGKGSYSVQGSTFDGDANAWGDTYEIAGTPIYAYDTQAQTVTMTAARANAGSGLVVDWGIENGSGLQLVRAAEKSAVGLGGSILNMASGLSAGSMAELGGRLYMTGVDHSAQGDGVGLYLVSPVDATSLGSMNAQVSARVDGEGGSAHVSSWNQEGERIDVRKSDTVTWKAEAQDGYRFVGWFADDGSKVTDDLEFSASAEVSMGYTARFEKSSDDPKPDDPKPVDPKPVDPKPVDPSKPDSPTPAGPSAPGSKAQEGTSAITESRPAALPGQQATGVQGSQPNAMSVSARPQARETLAATGDTNAMTLFALAALLAGASIVLVAYRKRG